MSSLTLALSGDIVPTRPLNKPAVSAQEVYDLVGGADVAIGNFEMALTNAATPLQKLSNRRADPGVAKDLPLLGFRVLTIANNHTVDYGWEGLSDTRTALLSTGVAVLGAGRTRDEASQPVMLDIHGQRIGIIAFSCLTPAGAKATDSRPGISSIHIDSTYEINPWYQIEEPGDPSAVTIRTRANAEDLEYAVTAIRQLRASCNYVIVTIHWGFGSGELLAEYQVPLGQALIDAGADIVHGHHPHAVHGVGFHGGHPIFYGPGTFMAQQFFLDATPLVKQMRAGMSRDGYVAQVALAGGVVGDIKLYPTTLDDDYLPGFARGANFDRIAERIERLSLPLGARIVAADGALKVRPVA